MQKWLDLGSQGGQVGYSPDFPFHAGGPGSTPVRGNQQQKPQKI